MRTKNLIKITLRVLSVFCVGRLIPSSTVREILKLLTLKYFQAWRFCVALAQKWWNNKCGSDHVWQGKTSPVIDGFLPSNWAQPGRAENYNWYFHMEASSKYSVEAGTGGNYLLVLDSSPGDAGQYRCSVSAYKKQEIVHQLRIRGEGFILLVRLVSNSLWELQSGLIPDYYTCPQPCTIELRELTVEHNSHWMILIPALLFIIGYIILYTTRQYHLALMCSRLGYLGGKLSTTPVRQ